MSAVVATEQTPLISGQGPSSARERKAAPSGLSWRSSSWFITTVVAAAVATDALCYSIVLPVLPFRLKELGYHDISQHTSWLLFSYSFGIFISIIPVAYFFHRYPWRREPLIVAVLVLEGSLVLLMLVQSFPAMVVARFLQGSASSVVFSVGFALICENVPEKNVGRQIGFALSGTSIGMTMAPPIGGALYTRFGWYAPFYLCITLCGLDLLARLFVIEQRDLALYGVSLPPKNEGTTEANERGELPSARAMDVRQEVVVELSLVGVLKALASSRRGMTGFCMTFIFGLVDGVLEPTLTLRIHEVWGKNSSFVGLVYLMSAIPTFVTGPVFGGLADAYGSEFIMAPLLAAVLPCLSLLLFKDSLIRFIAAFASTNFFLNAAIAPNGVEMAMGAKETEGISEIHQFASLNMAYAMSSAIGSIVGGQMYDRLPNGWTGVIGFSMAACALGVPIAALMGGTRPLLRRLAGKA